jgi:MoaA/NifB/PqqE/SkfB family radical SAM enzyme
MLWMGGEPLLRPDVLEKGISFFKSNTITTNGTLDPIELPDCTYVISIDGPPEINDAVRGNGSFAKVMTTLSRIPKKYASKIMCQCVVTRQNEDELEKLVQLLRPTRAEGMTFSFYVPRENDMTDLTWGSLERRDQAIHKVMALKHKYPDFVWNNGRSLELMLSDNAMSVTNNCPSKELILPLYLEGSGFVTPFCCYGNDVDCDLCGAWVVFYLAAKLEKRGEHVIR